jgi:hypothetical protein
MDTKINLMQLANTLQALQSCQQKAKESEPDSDQKIHWNGWVSRHDDVIQDLLKDLPHGSGLDAGVEFEPKESTPQKLVFYTSFHHMNDNGYYDGWTDHKLIITPLFGGFDIRITGKNKRQIKEYLSQLFYEVFTAEP